ncbi:MAG: Uma2 family endonuclease [Alphaproteobacteria bacterium]|jgi:Uma2 family endonuclease
MGQVIDEPATYADIEALPPNVVGEILFGKLVTHPRPAPKHAFAASSLGVEIGGPFQKGRGGPGGWIILDEPEIQVNGHVIVPDIAGWRQQRMPMLPTTASFQIGPDWVCEFLSPSTQRYDKGDKRAIYAEIGVEHLWYVDPVARVLEVFTRREQDWFASSTFFDEDPVSAPPFDAITFSLGELWPKDLPIPPASTPPASN